MADLPKISVVMASFNSEKVIEKSLKAIMGQNYPKEKVEVLVYDGGSTDQTREIAKRYGAVVRDNPETEPVAAKLKGYQQAAGDLLMYVDTDEVHLNANAFLERAELFTTHRDIQIAFSSGYSNPEGYPFINRYINSFGDPFSHFIYGVSKESLDSVGEFQSRLHTSEESESFVIFDMAKKPRNVLFENAAMGSTIRLNWFRSNFPQLQDSRIGPVHMFYHMLEKSDRFAIFKNQPIEHYSADTVLTYLKKIKWRVVNNIFLLETMGLTGFSGRKNLSNGWFSKHKKFLFLPYTLLLAPLAIDSVLISLKKRDPRFLIHFPLSVFTALTIVWYSFLKLLGIKKKLQAYGTDITININRNHSR